MFRYQSAIVPLMFRYRFATVTLSIRYLSARPSSQDVQEIEPMLILEFPTVRLSPPFQKSQDIRANTTSYIAAA